MARTTSFFLLVIFGFVLKNPMQETGVFNFNRILIYCIEGSLYIPSL